MKSRERTVLKNKIFEQLKEEIVQLGMIIALLMILFKIAFFREPILNVVKIVLAIAWLGIIPCYALMLKYMEKLGFMERTILGSALGFALLGILSYYLGLAGLHLKLHHIALPILEIALGVSIFYIGSKK